MNTYISKIDGLYFAGITEHEMGKSAVGGWYDEKLEIEKVVE